jgi:hypothetical protein
MKKTLEWVALCVVVLFVLTSFGAGNVRKTGKLSPTHVLVRVNGEEITWGQLNRHVDMMAELLKNKRKSITPQELARFKRKNIKPLSDELFRRAVIGTCLANSNITVLADARASVEKECARAFGKRGQTFADVKAYIDKAGFSKEFEKNIDLDARLRTFEMTVRSNEYYVSEAYLEKVKAGVAAYNERAAATNRAEKARADAVLARARKGEDFAKLADEFSEVSNEDRTPGGAMGDCDESDFPNDPHVWRALMELKDGDVSDVMQTEDGYEIFKVIHRNKPEESQTGGESLSLAHIFFRRAFQFPAQSDDEFRADVEKEVREKLQMTLFREFRALSKVSYPNGHVKAQ